MGKLLKIILYYWAKIRPKTLRPIVRIIVRSFFEFVFSFKI